MKINFGTKSLRLVSLCTVAVLFAAFAALTWVKPPVASAQIIVPRPWTAVASTGSIDETNLGNYAFSGPAAGYNPFSASLNPLEFRYNVTNTYDNNANPNVPGWTTLEIGGIAPGGSVVDATLIRVRRCDGLQTVLCQRRITQSTSAVCLTCTFPSTDVNFTADLYYVRVLVDRGVAGEQPQARTIRIY
jgi:hypothetical protein